MGSSKILNFSTATSTVDGSNFRIEQTLKIRGGVPEDVLGLEDTF